LLQAEILENCNKKIIRRFQELLKLHMIYYFLLLSWGPRKGTAATFKEVGKNKNSSCESYKVGFL